MKTEPMQIWKEYQDGVQYLSNNDIYEIVKINEDFFDGRQWEGVEADSLPKPVINVLQRVVKYLVATVSSNDVAISMVPFSVLPDDTEAMRFVSKSVEDCIEAAKIKEAWKTMIRNGAVDGSNYMMVEFDPEEETGQEFQGRIKVNLIDNTNMYYGNPYSNDTQSQPFIIVALRQYITQVKAEAEERGLKEDDINRIVPDSDTNQVHDDSDKLVTVLFKFYKQKKKENGRDIKTVWFTKCTKDVTIIPPVDTGYRRYPISCFGWDAKKNSYLYNSPMTAVIPNQIFINKCYALAEMYGMQSAFPKIVYDNNKIDIADFVDNITFGVSGLDIMGSVLSFIKVPDFSGNIINLIQDIMQQTKECMGVNDASLGNVTPDNTSAIIALQESSNVPLELQRQQYFQMVEDTIRNILDVMRVSYGVRQVMDEDGELALVDYSVLENINYQLRVDIGNGSQFSETAQMTTLNNLFTGQVIDGETLIENTPQKLLTNKYRILEKIKEQKEEAQAMAMQQAQAMPPIR